MIKNISTPKYPKKIFCKYTKSNNKILVPNGKSLVIKTMSSYYRYPLNKTPLNYILDKDFLIKKINVLEERIIDKSLINYTIKENDYEINIFFNKTNFDLMQHHKYSLTEIEAMIPWERDVYVSLLIKYIKEENERKKREREKAK